MKKPVSLLICFFMLMIFIIGSGYYALAITVNYKLQIANKNGSFALIADYENINDAFNAMNVHTSTDAVITSPNGTVLAMKKGMAVSAGYLDGLSTTPFIDSYEGRGAYISNLNAIYFNSSVVYNGQFAASVTVSGLTSRAYVKHLRLIPAVFYEDDGDYNGRYFLDYYSVNGSNELIHTLSALSEGNEDLQFDADEKCVAAAIIVDKAPSFMSQGVRYYSTDGKNFYLDSKLTNKAGTHYIYYKYLSYRSKTNYTEAELNSYIQYASNNFGDTAKQSILVGKASSFLYAQNEYGINAALEISFANHESAFGKSTISISKNNLFGINAVDSDPNQADSFATVGDCINYHANRTLSWGYFDAGGYIPNGIDMSYYNSSYLNGDGRYFGTSPGNKAFGVNVAYASDPYHGEKIAAHAYRLDKYLGFKDYEKYTVGESNKVTTAYSQSNTSAQALYKLSHLKSGTGPIGMPVIILGTTGDFYKIQSDMPVRFDIAGYPSGLSFYNWKYDLNTAFAYVLKSDINAENTVPYDTISMTMDENEQKTIDIAGLPATLEYLSGDTAIATVTADGIISAVDAGNTTITIKDSSTGLTVRVINLKVNSVIVAPAPIASTVFNVNGSNKIISKIAQKTTVSAFLTGLADSSFVAVYKDENQISGNSLLTTGCVVKLIKDSTVYETYTIAITGDIDSDGEITIADYVVLKNHLLKKSTLSSACLLSADIDNDDEVLINDYVLLKNHLLQKVFITPKSY